MPTNPLHAPCSRCLALLAALALAGTSGCTSQSVSSPPPPITYDQAWMSTVNLEQQYAEGYATNGYAPAIFTIPDRPFTALRTRTEWAQDGSPEQPLYATTFSIARDRAGRVHYEMSLRPGEVDVMISDPLSHMNYRYAISRHLPAHPESKQCTQPLMRDISRPYHSELSAEPKPVFRTTAYAPQIPVQVQAQNAPIPKDDRQELGAKDFAGVVGYGRQTLQYVSNRFGVKTMLIESWFSPDLGLSLLEVNDISGQNRTRVETHDIHFVDPDPRLFVPPPNYMLPATIPSCIPLMH